MKTFRLLRYQNEKNLGGGSGLIFYVIGGQTEIHRGESELLAQGRTVAYEDRQDLLELIPQKDVLFIIGDWNAKAGRNTWSNRQIWPWNME